MLGVRQDLLDLDAECLSRAVISLTELAVRTAAAAGLSVTSRRVLLLRQSRTRALKSIKWDETLWIGLGRRIQSSLKKKKKYIKKV